MNPVTEIKLPIYSRYDEWYEYCMVLGLESNYHEAFQWCEDKFGTQPCQLEYNWEDALWRNTGAYDDTNKYHYYFYFKKSEDAVLFALRWV